MNTLTKSLMITVPLLAVSFASNAHDPKEHMKKAEKANCAPLEKMKKENKKVNMTDPIMIAMMKKCEKKAQTKMKNHKEMTSENMNHDKMEHKMTEHKKKVDKKKGDDHNREH